MRVEAARRAPLVAACLAQRRELLDVGSGDERPLTRAAQDDRACLGVAVEPFDLGLELLDERCRERVHRRVVDRDERDGAVVLGGDERSQ